MGFRLGKFSEAPLTWSMTSVSIQNVIIYLPVIFNHSRKKNKKNIPDLFKTAGDISVRYFISFEVLGGLRCLTDGNHYCEW